MKRMKYLFGVSICLLFAVNAFSQQFGAGVTSPKEQAQRNKLYKKIGRQIIKSGAILKGGRDALPSLEKQYCSAAGDVVVVPESWHDFALSITWRVYTTAGGVQTDHPDWFTISGTGKNTKLIFLPHKVDPQYYGMPIVFNYVQSDGLGDIQTNYDYTYVYASPAVFNLGSGGEICQGQTYELVLDGSEIGVVYNFYRDGTLVNDVPEGGTGNPISYRVARAGVYTVKAINTSGNCESVMNGTATMVVNPLPVISISNDGPKCVGSDIQLSCDNNDMTYSWTGPGGFTSDLQNPLLPAVSETDAGPYILTVTDGNTCENSATTNVEVWGLPTVTASNTGPVCNDGSVTLQAAVLGGQAPYLFEWTKVPDAAVLSTDQNYVIDPVSLSDAGIYEVKVVDAHACAAPAASQTTLVVNERPTVTVSYNDPVCEGLALTLTATPSGGSASYVEYVWYKNGTEIARGASNTFTIASTVAPDDDGDYSVTVQDDGGCISDAVNVVVTIHPKTVATAVNDGPACVGENIQLTGGPAGMTSYSWTGPNGFASNERSPLISNATAAVAGDYTLTIIDGNTCTTDAVTTVVVNERPTITANNDSPVCEGQDVNLTSNVTGGTAPYTFSWTNVSTGTELSTQQNFTLPSVTLANAGQYQVEVTDDNACAALVPALTDVTVNPVATVTVSNDGPVCEGGDLTLSANVIGGTGPFTYEWVKVSSGTTVSTSGSYTINGVTMADAGEYQLTVIDDNGCSPANATSTIVIVNDQPTVSVSYNAPVCENSALTLTAVAAGGSTVYSEYVWYKDGVEISRGASNTYSIPSATPADNGNYSVVVEDNMGCISDPADVEVIVHPNPIATPANDGPACAGDNVQLIGGPASMTTYSWSGPNGFTSGEQSPILNAVTTADAGAYELVVTDANTCSGRATTIVEVNDIDASLNISPAPPGSSVCENTELTFVATGTLGSGDYSYQFMVNGSVQTTTGNSIKVTITENTTVSVTITDNVTGCSDTDLQSINMVPTPKASITSPNDNDEFCAGQPVTITASPYDPAWQYEFFYNDGSGDVSLGAPSNNNTITVADGFTSDVSIYVVTSIAFGCNSQSSEVNLVINPLPIPTITGEFAPCDGNVEHYTTEPGMNGYTWAYSGGQLVAGGNGSDFIEIRWNTPGPQSLSITYSDPNGCSPVEATTENIEVGILPVITITGDTEVCLNETTTYSTEAGMTGYVWAVDGGTIDAGQGSETITVTWDVQGVGYIEVNYVNNNDCGLPVPERSVVTVHNRPIPTITGDFTSCLNDTKIYTTQTGRNNYEWIVTGGTIVGANNLASVEVIWDNVGDWTISVNYEETAGNCAALIPTSETVVVNALPDPVVTGPSDVCAGSGGHIYSTDEGMTNYVWTIVGGAAVGTIDSSDGTNEVTVTWLTPGSQTIEVTYVDPNGCSPTQAKKYIVNVNALPIPTITGSVTVCNGSTMTYSTETGMTNYFWEVISGGTIVGADDTHEVVVDWNDVGDHELRVTYTDTNGCDPENSSAITVTVVDLPKPTINGLDVACEGHTITYSTQSGAINYDWQITGGTIVSDPALSSVDVIWSDPASAVHEISVNYELFGCPAATPFVLPVTVNAVPLVSLSGEINACVNSEQVYSTEAGQNNYRWNVNGGTILETAPYSNMVTVLWDVVGVGSIEVNYDNSTGCEAVEPTHLDVQVHPLPIPTISGNASVCNTYTSVYSTEAGMTEYSWDVSAGGTIVANDDNGTIEVEWNAVGNYTVRVSYKDSNSCAPSAPTVFNVEVLDTPVPTITGNVIACNNNIEVYTTEAGHANYQWVVPVEGTIVSGDATESITVYWNTPGTHTISVNYDYANGCSAPLATEMQVTVNPLSGVSLTASSTNVIVGTSVDFQADGTDVVNYVYKINGIEDTDHDGSANYTWTPNDISDDQTIVRVIAETSTGCKDSADITISVFEGVIPTNVLPLEQNYCEGSPETVSIYVSPDIIVGVTYELIRNEDSQLIGSTNVTQPATEVRWTHGVDGVDFTYAGTATYRVEAYWPDVPSDRIPMAHEVSVTEVVMPENHHSIQPTGIVTGCNAGAGYPIRLTGSEIDVIYTLIVDGVQLGDPIVGTGSSLDFGTHLNIGVYQIIANRDGCTATMNGTFEIEKDWSGIRQKVVGNPADGNYCDQGNGVEIILQGSEVGVEYVVNHNGIELTGETWVSDADDAVHTFGPYTDEGDYTINVKTPSGCYYPMDGVVTVNILPLPVVYNLLAEDNGHFCEGDIDGVEIYLENQEADIQYQLYHNGNPQGDPVTGVAGGGQLSFGMYLVEGEYSVEAVNLVTQCLSVTNDVIVVKDYLPMEISLQGNTAFCEGEQSILYVENPEENVDYELVFEGTPTGDFGTPDKTPNPTRIEWMVNKGGIYQLRATINNTYTTCGPVLFPGNFNLEEVPLPAPKTVEVIPGDHDACAGDTILVLDPEPLMRYALVSNITNEEVLGYSKQGSEVNSDGEVEFVINDNGGSYRVEAYNGTCSIILRSDIIINNPNAVSKKQLVLPDAICEGDGLVTIQLLGADADVNYDLYRVNGSYDNKRDTIIQTVSGQVGDISFDPLMDEGVYYVVGYKDAVYDADNPCNSEMLNRDTIKYNPLPIAYNLIAEPYSCGSTEATLALENTQLNYQYYLFHHNLLSGKAHIETIPGTGAKATFTSTSKAGEYSVYAISDKGCSSSMKDTVTVSFADDLSNFNVVGESPLTYCEADGAYELMLEGQENGVLYNVYSGTNLVKQVDGGAVGDALSLGLYTEGTYAITATRGTGCFVDMNGGAEVLITMQNSPQAFDLSVNDGSVCGNTSAIITLNGSEEGQIYILEADGIDQEDPKVGTADGAPITWEVTEPVSGEVLYEVIAVSGGLCDVSMGMIEVNYKEMPDVPILSPDTDKEYCFGEEGVKVSLIAVEPGIDYYIVDEETGNRISFLSGDAGVLEFKEYVIAGTYNVTAKQFDNGCTNISDPFTIISYPEIQKFNMQVGTPTKGFKTIEEGEIGTGTINVDSLGLNLSTGNVKYTLLKDNEPYSLDYVLESGTGNPFVYPNAISEGGIYTILAEENGCSRLMAGSVNIFEKPLEAIDDILPVSYGQNLGDTNVWINDVSLSSIDINVGSSKNIYFKLVGCNEDINPEELVPWDSEVPQPKHTKDREGNNLNMVEIYVDGKVEFTKLPSFYGRDSIDYIVYNTDYLQSNRYDRGRIYFFAGNINQADDELLIPNAFSPNGDGINDEFVISQFKKEPTESKLEVYNRWGTLVYRSKGKKYTENFWDGKSNAGFASLGDELPDGTYFYVFKIDISVDKEEPRSSETVSKEYCGYIELRR